MKTIKITLLLTVIVSFVSILSTVEAKHCSHTKTLAEKLQCAGDSSQWNKAESSSDEIKAESSSDEIKKDKKVKKAKGESFNEKYKTLADVIERWRETGYGKMEKE